MSFAEEEGVGRSLGHRGVPQGHLLQGDPGKEEQGGLFKDTYPGKAGPAPPWFGESLNRLGQEHFQSGCFSLRGRCACLSLGNRQGPVGSQLGVKADGDKIK